jgi:hypothetical protein
MPKARHLPGRVKGNAQQGKEFDRFANIRNVTFLTEP